jgi:hypothetical protein
MRQGARIILSKEKAPWSERAQWSTSIQTVELRRFEKPDPSADPMLIVGECIEKTLTTSLRTELPLMPAPANETPFGRATVCACFLSSDASRGYVGMGAKGARQSYLIE